MTLMKRCHLLVVLCALCILPPATRAADETFFPIMAWNMAPGDAKSLGQMKECGLTVAGFVFPKDLDAVQAAGLKAIVSDPRTSNYDWTNVDGAKARKNVESLVAEVNQHPAVIGYYLRDEPPASYFDGLEKVASVVRELAPGKWPYINLFPNYAEASQLATPDYQTYVDRFIATCHPPVLSYDHYALYESGLQDRYWTNLEQMRAAAIKAKVPFWNIVLAVAHFNHREPTFADFRIQVFSTLAYGGRGLAYFTYFAPKVGNYRMAPIDQFENKTPNWYFMQNVNQQVLKLAPTLLKLRSDEVYHFGKPPPGARPTTQSSLLTSAGSDQFMAGDFTHADDGSRWVMVVNKSLTSSIPCAPQPRTPIKGPIQLLSAYTGELTPFEGEQVWLAPGQGVLLKLGK
jgi:hypothetical protein